MAISPRYASHILGKGPVSIDIYLDYVCRFSNILYKKLRTEIYPEVEKQFPGQFQFVFKHQIQPWHPSSTLVHEAALAVGLLAPEKFWAFSDALFAASPEYYDEPVYNESRPETYKRLAKLAHESAGVDEAKFLELLAIAPSEIPKNAANALQKDVKYFVRESRQNGIHVSPTVLINGIVDNSFESSTPTETWVKKLGDVKIASSL